MKKIKDFFDNIAVWYNQPRSKKKIYIALGLVVVIWVIYRFAMIGVERRMFIFNPARDAAANGVVIEVLPVKKENGILREPLTVKSNHARVSTSRVDMFAPGQVIGNGTIVSVSQNIDLDTGMHTITTRGVSDGLNYVEYKTVGYFVPTYALVGDTAYIVRDGTAHAVKVTVAHSDADTSVISAGLQDGDIVILSRVSDGQKVQIKQQER